MTGRPHPHRDTPTRATLPAAPPQALRAVRSDRRPALCSASASHPQVRDSVHWEWPRLVTGTITVTIWTGRAPGTRPGRWLTGNCAGSAAWGTRHRPPLRHTGLTSRHCVPVGTGGPPALPAARPGDHDPSHRTSRTERPSRLIQGSSRLQSLSSSASRRRARIPSIPSLLYYSLAASWLTVERAGPPGRAF